MTSLIDRSAVLLALLVACAADTGPQPNVDRHVDPLVLEQVGPAQLLPGTRLVIEGEGFAHPDYGPTRIEIRGGDVDLARELEWVSEERLELVVDRELFDALGGGGDFEGGARLVHPHRTADVVRASRPIGVRFDLDETLSPPSRLDVPAAVYVNDPIPVDGGGILLGGAEGETLARVWGCFFPDGSSGCVSVEPVEVTVSAESAGVRTAGAFLFAPSIAGVGPGVFRGSVQLVNAHGDPGAGRRIEGDTHTVELRVLAPAVHDVSVLAASLGQYVDIEGGGFVSGSSDGVTLLEVRATFRSSASGNERTIDVVLVPEYQTGRRVRYVLSEEDALGEALSLRRERGRITGTIQPVVRWGSQEARGDAVPFAFDLAPLKQVVYLSFQPSYVESLRLFGMRAADPLVREQIVAAASEPYRGINLEFRTEVPSDFALYAHVDLAGPDPNGTGLFGYDNSPGKDTNNLRLHDRIGGVNATTQLDGYPGYGGVFVESFIGFSEHPGAIADPLPGASPLFDAVFDPFRPDRGGRPVTAEELREPLPVIRDGNECPAPSSFREGQIACAIWVLGNLVGTTVAHEVGHSLGLANPHGEGFHNDGDLPGRLMDSGGARPFEERAVISGGEAGVFCADSYEYLHEIMPGEEDDPLFTRPSCF